MDLALGGSEPALSLRAVSQPQSFIFKTYDGPEAIFFERTHNSSVRLWSERGTHRENTAHAHELTHPDFTFSIIHRVELQRGLILLCLRYELNKNLYV